MADARIIQIGLSKEEMENVQGGALNSHLRITGESQGDLGWETSSASIRVEMLNHKYFSIDLK